MPWFYILFIAVIVEGLISYFNMMVKNKKIQYEVVASAAIGIAISLIYDIDLFTLIDINTKVPYIGCILTGILISRGSNYIYDLLKKIIGIRIDTATMEKQYNRPKNEINTDTVNHEV